MFGCTTSHMGVFQPKVSWAIRVKEVSWQKLKSWSTMEVGCV